jgi:hypothetical protein
LNMDEDDVRWDLLRMCRADFRPKIASIFQLLCVAPQRVVVHVHLRPQVRPPRVVERVPRQLIVGGARARTLPRQVVRLQAMCMALMLMPRDTASSG